MLWCKSERSIWESPNGGGKRAIAKPTPLPCRCVRSRTCIQGDGWELRCGLCLSPAVAVWISPSPSSSLFLQLANKSSTRAWLCCRVQLTALLCSLLDLMGSLTSWCSLSWRKGKQWIPWGDRGFPACITEESYPTGRAQNHSLGRSWQKSGITFWTLTFHETMNQDSPTPHVICPGQTNSSECSELNIFWNQNMWSESWFYHFGPVYSWESD